MRKTSAKRVAMRAVSLALAMMFSFVSVDTMQVKAARTNNTVMDESEKVPIIMVDRYEVDGENAKIVPGENFTLKVYLKNYSDVEATGVRVDIENPNGVAPVYGTVSQLYIGEMGPGSTKLISFDYNSWTSITSDTLDFYVAAVFDGGGNSTLLRIPAGSDIPFNIMTTTFPNQVSVGEAASASISFKVLGADNVSNVAVCLEANGESVATSNLGILTPGSTKIQNLSFYLNEVGDYDLEIKMEYSDESGVKQSVPVANTHLTVNEASKETKQDTTTVVTEPNNEGSDNMMLMAVSGVLILAIFVGIVVVLKKTR